MLLDISIVFKPAGFLTVLYSLIQKLQLKSSRIALIPSSLVMALLNYETIAYVRNLKMMQNS